MGELSLDGSEETFQLSHSLLQVESLTLSAQFGIYILCGQVQHVYSSGTNHCSDNL